MPAVNTKLSPQEIADKLMRIQKETGTCFRSLIESKDDFVRKIVEINELKKKKNAVILVHTYVVPEIIYGVGDYVGDSYALSKNALETKAKLIVFAGVRFMGETAKILNPEKDVVVPGLEPDCTLADAITPEQVRELRKKYPDYTFVCYINTSVKVKAECDVCVTSSNVNKIVANIENEKIYFLPDKMMGQNLITDMKKKGIKKDIKYFTGTCYVHEEYTYEQLKEAKLRFPNSLVVSHPECQPEVCNHSDFVGSTADIFNYMAKSPNKEFIMLTECGLAARFKMEFPDKKIVGTCNFCKYMKSNTLDEIIRVMKNPTPQDFIKIDETLRVKALRSIEAMFKYAEK